MKKCLILDIDETLLHSTYENLKAIPDFKYKERNVYLRPGWESFMDFCFTHFDVGIWTVAQGEYADFLMTKMGCKGQLKFLYHRDHCTEQEHFNGFFDDIKHLKDLRKLKTYPLKNIIMIDDTPQFVEPVENVLMIPEFRGEPEDRELKIMMEKLKGLC